jgi:hypothetical protein
LSPLRVSKPELRTPSLVLLVAAAFKTRLKPVRSPRIRAARPESRR